MQSIAIGLPAPPPMARAKSAIPGMYRRVQLSYNKHEIADPNEAFSLVARVRLREDVDPNWREAGRRARAFFLERAAKT